ncbi:MAG TPA: porin family protein [Cyclobacteriaceae bacterium]|nr:porin family protein [Cyclobacteriaceae bacterium]
MKKTTQLGVILGMIFLSQNSFGQTNESGSETIKEKVTQKTYLDLVLNAVSTNFHYGSANRSLADYKKTTLGGQLGVSFRAGISPKFSLVSELYFLMKGGSLQANNPLTTNKSTLRLYTIELPVLARYHFGKFHVNAGPSLAYNFYGTQEIEGSTSSLSFNNSPDGFKRWDAGVQVGAGYTFNTKRKRVALDIRYNYGLTNIAYSGEMHNRSLILALHFSKPWKTNPLARR